MSPPRNSTCPGPLGNLTLRQTQVGYPALNQDNIKVANHESKVALITGSARGIGKAMAFAFAEAGYSIGITSRSPLEIESTVEQLTTKYPLQKFIGVSADACQLDDLNKLVTIVNNHLGIIDVLICNAGTNTFMPFSMTNATDWWQSIAINLKSPTELTRIVLPQMKQANRGTIIYTSSRAAVADLPWTSAYSCGKTAITRFAACLQNELDQTQRMEGHDQNGISLFSIHPGEIETSLHTTAFPEQTKLEAPYIIEHMKSLDAARPKFEASLPAWTCVALASGTAECLRGKYIDCTRDLDEQKRLVENK